MAQPPSAVQPGVIVANELKPAEPVRVDPNLLPVEALRRPSPAKPQEKAAPGAGFDEVLREKVTGLKFSSHADERIRRRNIEISFDELERLKTGVDKAAAKGSRDSLVMVDDKAFVVSVKNRTVITALAGTNVKEGVFTNIDSAVVT